MKINFYSIKIENFKNFSDLETKFGNKTYVYGANETGKTSFADAISWCLTGKSSLGDSQFEFLPLQNQSSSPSVALELEIDDGKKKQKVTLKRIYIAKLNKEKEYVGEHQTVCYINGLKIGVKEFDKWIEEHICSHEIFRLIHDVRYFTENISTNGKERPWETQRRLLFSISGIKPDLEFLRSKKRFKPILDGVEKYDTANQYITFLKSEEKRITDEIKYLDGRISIATSMIENVDDCVEIDTQIERLRKEKEQLKIEIEQSESQSLNGYDRLCTEQSRILSELSTIRSELTVFDHDLKVQKEALENIFVQCPVCGQYMPVELVEDKKKEISSKISSIKLDIKKKELEEKDIMRELHIVSNKIGEFKRNNDSTLQNVELRNRLKEIEHDLSNFLEKKEIILKNEKIKETIKHSEEKIKCDLDLKAENSRLIDLCKDFIDTKCKYAEKKVNEMFDGITIRMFRKNKTNDEIVPCCDIYWNGIPYRSLSYSTKFLVSMKIALAFQKFYKVEMPIIIDNAESINLCQEVPVQSIFLVKEEEYCECSGETGRKELDGLWTCKSCGKRFEKKLEIMLEK